MNSISRFIILCLVGGNLVAQSGYVQGIVLDGGTGRPLTGVNVMIQSADLGDATDLEGHFSIEVPIGEYSLSASMMGYEVATLEISISQDQVLAVQLSMTPGSLESKQMILVIGDRLTIP